MLFRCFVTVILLSLPSLGWAEFQFPVIGPTTLSRDWKRIRSEHFTAVGDAGEAQLRDALVQLERFRTALVALVPASDLSSPVPTELVLFKHQQAMSRGKMDSTAGYFARRPHVNRMVTAVMPNREDMFNVLQHEYTHYVLHLSGHELPAWIDEGLAEFYGTFRMYDRSSGLIGEVPPWRRDTLATGDYALAFEQLFTADGINRAFQVPMNVQRFYSSAWALVHYMVVGDRAGQLALYLRALGRGMSPQAAFQEAFKVSYDTLQSELRTYLNRRRLPGMRVPFASIRAETNPAERLTEVDALQLQAELILDEGAIDEAEPVVRRVLQIDPQHVNGRRTLAALQWQRRQWDDALATMRALALDAPKDFAVQYALATYLTAYGDPDAAFRVADTAVTLNSGAPHAWVALSVAAIALGRTGQADTAMRNAQTIFRTPDWYYSRAHSLWGIGHNAGIVRDVETFAAEAGWGNETAPYAAFLAVLAHRKVGERDKALDLLNRAAPGIGADTWTARVAAFLRGELTAERFLDRAKGVGEQTEAHAYIGITASIDGRRDEARRHLQWVRDRGARGYSEYRLSIAELRRLEAAK